MMTPDEREAWAAGAVRKGAVWLDEHYPGWMADVDFGAVDLECGYLCILGQLAKRHARFHHSISEDRRDPSFWSFMEPSCRGSVQESLGERTIYGTVPVMMTPDQAIDLGFDVSPEVSHKEALLMEEALSHAWSDYADEGERLGVIFSQSLIPCRDD